MLEPSLLLISQVCPYPPNSGGSFDVYHRIQALHALGCRITLIAFVNPALTPPDIGPLEALCERVYLVPFLRRQWSKILHWKPYFIGSKENQAALEPILQELEGERFSALLAESHHVLTVAKQCKQRLCIPKLFLRSHNDEARFILSIAQSCRLFSLKQLFYLVEAGKYRIYQPRLLKLLDKEDTLLHISHAEWRQGKQNHPEISQTFLPAGVDLSRLRKYHDPGTQNVLFSGALFSPNNLQGIRWYLKNVHPELRNSLPGYRLLIAGNTQGADPKEIKRLLRMDPEILFFDTPEDLSEIYAQAQVFINPMRFGAGVKLKTIDALLHGLPVVATSVGNEGTGLVGKRDILIGDSPEEMRDAICLLLTNPQLRESMVHAAQAYLIEHYDQKRALWQTLSRP